MEVSKITFVNNNQQYGYKTNTIESVDQLRTVHFSRLQVPHPVTYLDHAGTTLPSEDQLKKCFEYLSQTILANPHSSETTSILVDKMRERILNWLGTDSKHYSVVFTSNSTASIKLVAENFKFTKASKLRLTLSNHTSCLGMREYALEKGAAVEIVDSNNDESIISKFSINQNDQDSSEDALNLFVYPGESNFSGVKFPLEWVHKYHQHLKERWLVLLDASAYLSNSSLNLSEFPFDFVSFSFYKIFGYPTGVGALIIRNEIESISLEKKFFGGGTVNGMLATERFHSFRSSISGKYEDGTVSFSNIPILSFGFDLIESIGGLAAVSRHTHCLTQYLFTQLDNLKHYNGTPLCLIYGNHHLNDLCKQGPIIGFTLVKSNQQVIGYSEVERLASANSITLRTGCFCNPGECHQLLKLSPSDVKSHLSEGHVCWDENDIIKGKSTGAIRISLGYMNTFEDCYRFIDFLKKYFIEKTPNTLLSSQLNAVTVNDDFHISKITLYPIKSCAGFSVNEWEFGNRGLLFDRNWAIVDQTGRPLSAKNDTRLLSIKPVIDLKNNLLIISAPDMSDLILSLVDNTNQNFISLRVCGDVCEGFRYSDDVNEWFSKILERDCTFVRQNIEDVDSSRLCKVQQIQSTEESLKNHLRQIVKDEKPQLNAPSLVSFANESQVLFINQKSVEYLRDQIGTSNKKFLETEDLQTTIDRFRGNIVINGPEANSEDHWAFINFEDFTLKCLGPCVRCRMICVHPLSGSHDVYGEPLSSLSLYRKLNGRIIFGRHATSQHTMNQPVKIYLNQRVSIN